MAGPEATDFTPDGRPIDPQDPGKIVTPEKDGGGGASTTIKGSASLTKDEKAALLRNLLNNYRLQYGGKVPPMPKGLINAAVRNRWYDVTNIRNWLRKNDNNRYLRTSVAIARQQEAMQKVDALFGESYKWKDRYIKAYVKADPNAYNWGTYLDKVVVKSQGFKQLYPGWVQFTKQQENQLKSNEELISDYRDRRNEVLKWYNAIVQNGAATLNANILTNAIVEGWNEDQFKNIIVTNDPNYLDSPEAKEKANQLTSFWQNVFGKDTMPAGLAEKWKSSTQKFGDFFNENIRTTEEFKAKAPYYETWARAKSGLEGDEDVTATTDIDPADYFKEHQAWTQYYETLSEKIGASNEEMVQKAMEGNWSEARFQLEFQKNDPAYGGTAKAMSKQEQFTQYWKQLFGVDAVPDKKMQDEYVRSNSERVESTFDTIKQTAEFQRQYGEWDEFAKAQTGKGYASEVINNPQVYKQYENAFYEEFRKVGIEPPTTWKQDFFGSGLDDTQLSQNLQTWLNTSTSYETMTGQKADVQTAAGIKGTLPGADLRSRMEKALAAHKDFASSKFNQFDIEKKTDNTLIRNI